jgi:uncharacterized membrane protein YccC
VGFFVKELAPSYWRVEEAARTAAKATITTGLAASMQILGPFGPLFAFRIGQPGVSLSLFEGAVVIVCAAAMQAAIVPITGRLLDYPGLILAFVFTVFAAVAYLLSNTRLFMPLALVTIATITTAYVGIFRPGSIGWGSTYTFDGILAATLVMVALDTYIWPSSPEQRLLEIIGADLENARKRFQLASQHYLDPQSTPLAAAVIKSTLMPSLALLNSVEQRLKPGSHRVATLLHAVMTSEEVYLGVERLAVLADEPVPYDLRKNHQQEIESVLELVDAAFAELIDRVLAGLPNAAEVLPRAAELDSQIQNLRELRARTSSSQAGSITPETWNFVGFLDALQEIASLLDPRERPHGEAVAEAIERDIPVETPPPVDPARLRFSIKLGAAITLGLLVGLTTQRTDLQTILWSIAVAGQPNQYGAVVRKTILRLAGCIMGGLAALATMLIVSQHFESLTAYLVAIFAVMRFSTYVSQSSEWLGYAGIQTGITFLICYVGLAPSSNIYEPLWRFWGIVLGVLTTGFVFLFLWPEYASDKVVASLKRLMRTTLELAKDVTARSATDGRPSVIERHLHTDLLQVLNMADQGRLEGTRGREVSKAAFEVAAFLIRIAYRFQTITRARLAGSERYLSDQLRQRCAALEGAFCHSLESGLEKLRSVEPLEELTAQAVRAKSSEQNLNDAELLSRAMIRDANCTTYAHADWTTQLEAYRRMPILLSRLDSALSKIVIH